MPDSTCRPLATRLTVLVRDSMLLPAKAWGCSTPVDADPLQRLLDQADGRPLDVGVMLEEVARQRRAEALDRLERVLLGQRVGDVLHRVRRDDQAVVAGGVRAGEIPFELDLDRQLADVVAVGPARDLRQPDPRLAVGMLGEDGGHDRVPPHLAGSSAVDSSRS